MTTINADHTDLIAKRGAEFLVAELKGLIANEGVVRGSASLAG
ncbi:hypothetical protein QT381_01755 [Galbitalea sp. SE-J8]|nr:hypothetical protein [Galbitalea sp. SE-J8]MDM4761728.1 hypothetical protein [Galbitalea sp. SE-J8]